MIISSNLKKPSKMASSTILKKKTLFGHPDCVIFASQLAHDPFSVQ